MKSLIKWVLDYAATQREFKRIKIEGKQTEEAHGRSERLKEARGAKEALRRAGNKNPGE